MASAALALGLLLPLPGWATCKLKALELPVTMVGERPITTVGINGTDVKMLVDSGAFFSTLTDAAATQLGLRMTHLPFGMEIHGITGEMEARRTDVKRLQVRNGEVKDVEFVVGGNEPGGGAMGLLGRNLLSFTDAEYDLANGVVRLMLPEGDCDNTMLAYWAGSTPVAEMALLRERGDKAPPIRARASLNGKSIQVLFDTGATSVVSLTAARRAGIASEQMKSAGHVGGVGRGRAKAWTAPIETFELGGERIGNSHLLVADIDLKEDDMLIGVDFFLSHRIYVARGQRKIYFTYNGGPVFAMNEVGDPTPSGADPPEDANAPTDGAGYARRGAAAAARGDNTRALADLNRACELEPAVAGHFTRRGMVQLALKQTAKALQDFDEALRIDPAEAEARLLRARVKAALGERDATIDDLRVLDKALPPQAHMRLEMGRVYARFDMYDQALPQWNQWIAAHPNEATLHNALNERCWARAMLGIELDQALDDCNAALKQQPDNPNYLDSRAWVQVRLGRFREAITDFDRALKLRPQAAWSLYGRGIARIRQGEREQGMADIDAARQLQALIDTDAGRHGITVP